MKSKKMKAFYITLFVLILFQTYNIFFMKSTEVFQGLTWGVVSLAGLATGGKVLDDFQRGKNFNPELYNKSKEGEGNGK
jgi:hypothetical protein